MPAKTETSPIYDDEIDLRVMLRTLWASRWVIMIVTLTVAVVTFAVNFWLLPRTYQAFAYVFVGNPIVDFVNPPDFTGIEISPTLPDINAVVKLADAPGVLENVLNDPRIAAANASKEISAHNIGSMTVVNILGKDQISLMVTDTDPQRAALLANIWAENVTDTVNATYGVGAVSKVLASQISLSLQEYQQAQGLLSDALSKSQVDTLNAQVETKIADLNNVLGSIIRTNHVLDDLQFFEQGLSGRSGDMPLTLGDGLALTTLRQSSLTVVNGAATNDTVANGGGTVANTETVANGGIIVQIDSNSFAGFTVSSALDTAAKMQAALQTQLTRLKSDQSNLEQEIPKLQRDLDNANDQLSQITAKRDQSRDFYQSLLLQHQRIDSLLKQHFKVAAVSVEAVPPDSKSSPKVVANTAVAGMFGLFVSVIGVLAVDWYRKDPKKSETS